MLPVFWFLLVLGGTLLLALILLPWGVGIYERYRGARAVVCPETKQQVAVRLDALHATVTGGNGTPALRLAECTRWPERVSCDEGCIPEALRTLPYTRGEVARPKTKRIYHLPVIAAGFLAWVVGALWHSQHFLRTRWMEALGLRPADIEQIIRWWTPHLLSVAACFLFAYGVAGLLAYRGKQGIGQAVLTSLVVWLAIGGASVIAAGLAGIPRDVLRIELGYTFIASLVVGTIIGGLSGKLREQALAGE